MDRRIQTALLLLGVLSIAVEVRAQSFDSGSNGSLGDLVVPLPDNTQGITLDVPPDGVFNFRTITLNRFGTITFRRNALNTPVYLLATGDIVTVPASSIIVDGESGTSSPSAGGLGGPGGFDGGQPGFEGVPPGDGNGPGGGLGGAPLTDGAMDSSAGAAAYGSAAAKPSASDGMPYGSPLLVPIVGGSGGGGSAPFPGTPGSGRGGGGGGGAIVIASSTRIVIDGSISAKGGSSFDSAGGGSGGAVRLVAPVVSGGSSAVVVSGGFGQTGLTHLDTAGGGRVRIDALDRRGLSVITNPPDALSVGAFMAVFPPVVPKLDLIEVGGQAVAPGAPAEITLPFGADAVQPVKVRATAFTGTVPFDVVLVPDSGPRSVVSTQVTMTTDPTEVMVNATFPINNRTRVWAWTR
jgi:hypothetical protein